MSDRYMTVAAMLDDPDTLVCVLRELRRRHGMWPEAANLYAAPWRGEAFGAMDHKTVRHVLYRLSETNSSVGTGQPQPLACVEEDEGGWCLVVPGEGEYGPFDTADEAKQEAERLLLESGEVAHLLTEFPWTPEDDMEWPMPAPSHKALYK